MSSQPNASRPQSPKSQDLVRRRQYLRAQRRSNFYKAAWRSLALVALSAGTLWLATSPVWLIRSSKQIEVSGNQLLSDEIVRSLVSVPYPQALIKVKPDELARDLSVHQPIEEAVISRRLLPVGLRVRIKERQPVALTLPDTRHPLKAIPTQPVPFREPGLLDAEGYWMPRNSFDELEATVEPALTVKGMRPANASSWPAVYRAVSRSPVKISVIDWSRPSNLMLQTELGTVHLGPYGENFQAQLTALDQLRSLNTKVSPERVTFIDLHDPNHPVIEVLQATNLPADARTESP